MRRVPDTGVVAEHEPQHLLALLEGDAEVRAARAPGQVERHEDECPGIVRDGVGHTGCVAGTGGLHRAPATTTSGPALEEAEVRPAGRVERDELAVDDRLRRREPRG